MKGGAPRAAPRRAVDGILLLDKPSGISSNAALQRVKRLYVAAKAGHTGALDPLATGLLPVCLGEATKLSAFLLDADKVYTGRARLGSATSTGDLEGATVRSSDPGLASRSALEAAIPRFLGVIRQVPPMYSALKRDGRPLYELARAGVEVERDAREVVIHQLRLLDFDAGEFGFEVRCSKGTYVRTLAEDWASAIGQAAHLVALRRTALGPFGTGAMIDLEKLEMAAGAGFEALDRLLLPPIAALRDWPRATADAVQARLLANGQPAVLAGAPASGRVAVVGLDGRLLGIAEIDAAGQVAPRRWLVSRVKA